MKLPSVAFHPIDETLLPDDISKLPRAPRRIMEILKKGSTLPISSAEKSWSLDFCLSPTEFIASSKSAMSLGGMSFEKTKLSPDSFDPTAKGKGTGELANVPADVAFRSIGYKSEPLSGSSDYPGEGVPFNDRLGIIPNDGFGRIVQSNGSCMPGAYCAGWVKRGPTGVIASTMQDAFTTADSIIEDYDNEREKIAETSLTHMAMGRGWDAVKYDAEKRSLRRVSWEDWKKIDSAEKANGRVKGKEREKFTRIEDMLAVLD
jgi:adrenodoxin-NADP+ reductase